MIIQIAVPQEVTINYQFLKDEPSSNFDHSPATNKIYVIAKQRMLLQLNASPLFYSDHCYSTSIVIDFVHTFSMTDFGREVNIG